MSKAHTSPTTRLLQGSRLFSLPKALPTPFGPAYRGSESATTPYPLRQTIETPQTSQSLGDWGLKRRLPKKNLRHTGTPTIRVLAQDTSDHVTDFSSSSDHERSLIKFQELGIPLLQRDMRQNKLFSSSGSSVRTGHSVYEDNVDNTKRVGSTGRRWKQDGPWLGGITEQELEEYLVELQKRQPAWSKYVAEMHVQKSFEQAKSEALASNGHFGPLEIQDLKYRVEYLTRKVEEEATALRKELTEEGLDEDEINQRCQEVGSSTMQWIDAQQDALKLQEKRDSAIALFTKQYQAAARSFNIAEEELTRVKGLIVDSATLEEITSRATKMREGASEQMSMVAQQVIDLLDPYNSPDSAEERQQRARILVQEAAAALKKEMLDVDELQAAWADTYKQNLRPTSRQLQGIYKQLRDDHLKDQLGSELTEMLVGFCDFAGMTSEEVRLVRIQANRSAQTAGFRNLLSGGSLSDLAQATPLSTHPGAGLGYLRSGAYMQNHPIFGPQSQHASVNARVLRPRTSVLGSEAKAKLGVGGFVAEDPKHTTFSSRSIGNMDRNDPDVMAVSLDPYIVGGNKLFVQPLNATIRENGRVEMQVTRADKEAIAVQTGNTKSILDSKRAVMIAQSPAGVTSSMPGRSFNIASTPTTRKQPDHESLKRIQEFKSSLQSDKGIQTEA